MFISDKLPSCNVVYDGDLLFLLSPRLLSLWDQALFFYKIKIAKILSVCFCL